MIIQPALQLKGLKRNCPLSGLDWHFKEAPVVGHQLNLPSAFAAAFPLETLKFESHGASME